MCVSPGIMCCSQCTCSLGRFKVCVYVGMVKLQERECNVIESGCVGVYCFLTDLTCICVGSDVRPFL